MRVSNLTRILEAAQQGDLKAADELLPAVYQELRRLAAHKIAHELPGQTLQPTALVHEAWLRVSGDADKKWDGRAHFFAAAAEAMRRILIDRARRKADRKSTRLNSSHSQISYAVLCLKKKTAKQRPRPHRQA